MRARSLRQCVAARRGDHGATARLFATAPAASSSYASDMHAAWSKDRTAVHPDWDAYFSSGGSTSDAPASATTSAALTMSVTVAGQGVKETMGLLSVVTGFRTRAPPLAAAPTRV